MPEVPYSRTGAAGHSHSQCHRDYPGTDFFPVSPPHERQHLMAPGLMKTSSQPGRLYVLLGVRDLLITASHDLFTAGAQLTSRVLRMRASSPGVPAWVAEVLAALDSKTTILRRAPQPTVDPPRSPDTQAPAVGMMQQRSTVELVSPLL
jgi:hypothetical protein